MSRSARVAWAALLVVVIVMAALDLVRRPAAAASALSATAEGWLAARVYLERRGDRVALSDRPLDRGPDRAALLLGFPWQALPSPEELDALRQRVAGGGTVVFAYSGRRPGPAETLVARALGLHPGRTRGDPPLAPARWWAFVNAESRLQPDRAFAADRSVREVVIGAPDYAPAALSGADVLYRGAKGEPRVFAGRRGRGRVIVLPADALSNGRLENAGNADLLESLRSALSRDVAFDEYHHGLAAADTLATSGSAASLDLLLGELLLLYVLCAWTLGRHFGPAWRETPEIAGSASEFLVGLGRLHRRLGHAPEAALRLLEDARRWDTRVAPPRELVEAAAGAGDNTLLSIAKSVARLQGRGRSA